LSCLKITIGAVGTTAVGISGAAAVLAGIVTSGVRIGLGKGAAVGVSVTVLDDWAVVDTTGLVLTGVSSIIGIALGLTITL